MFGHGSNVFFPKGGENISELGLHTRWVTKTKTGLTEKTNKLIDSSTVTMSQQFSSSTGFFHVFSGQYVNINAATDPAETHIYC